jgi:predicted dehydrogenase
MSAPKRELGLAVVGAGKIGRHRARLAAEHPAVRRLEVVDVDPSRAARLATEVDADGWSSDLESVLESDQIDAVIVSTPEGGHRVPVTAALEAGKRVLVEKPIALTLEDADQMVRAGGDLRVAYSMRYAQRYAVAKQQLAEGKIGSLVGGLARVYDTVAVGRAILDRSPTAGPVADILTYAVDILCWYVPARPVEVVARSHGTILRAEGHDVDDLVFAVITFDDGSVFDLAVSYSLPAGYPIAGLATRFELLGDAGVLFVTEDHGDQVLYSEHGYDNAYVDQHLELAYLGSRTSGEWALGRMFGRVADETRAWLDHLSTGAPCHITTAVEARQVLAVTIAIETAARSGGTVAIDGGKDHP